MINKKYLLSIILITIFLFSALSIVSAQDPISLDNSEISNNSISLSQNHTINPDTQHKVNLKVNKNSTTIKTNKTTKINTIKTNKTNNKTSNINKKPIQIMNPN